MYLEKEASKSGGRKEGRKQEVVVEPHRERQGERKEAGIEMES